MKKYTPIAMQFGEALQKGLGRADQSLRFFTIFLQYQV